MRRRDVVRSLGVAASIGAVPGVAGGQAGRAFEPLGTLELPGAKEAVVSADGRTAYVAVTDGFATVDLSEPTDPTVFAERRELLADRPDGPLQDVYDCKVDGDTLALAGPANPRDDALEAAVVYDVNDPAAPSRRTVVETGWFNHNLDVDDGVLYLCGNGEDGHPLVTVDAETGERLGSWSILTADEGWRGLPFGLWPLHDVSVQDGVACLAYWDAGTWLVDVSDPADPTAIARIRGRDASTFAAMPRDEASREPTRPPGNDHFVTVDDSGDLLGISVESWAVEVETDDGSTELRGGPGAVHLFDVSDPTAPEPLSTVEPPPTPDPTFGGTWTTSHNFELADDRLYSSWYAGGIRLFDVSDPTEPALLGRWRDSSTTSIWTARQGVLDEFLVASSYEDHSRAEPTEGAQLLTFPDAGEPFPSASAPTPSRSPTPTRRGTVDPTATARPSPTPTDTPTAGDGPGLGVVAALGGLGLAAWRAASRGDGD